MKQEMTFFQAPEHYTVADQGWSPIRRHPETGVSIDGFRIPFWQEAVELARDAHLRFDSFGYLGWDVAITPTGPKIIEANAWVGSQTTHRRS